MPTWECWEMGQMWICRRVPPNREIKLIFDTTSCTVSLNSDRDSKTRHRLLLKPTWPHIIASLSAVCIEHPASSTVLPLLQESRRQNSSIKTKFHILTLPRVRYSIPRPAFAFNRLSMYSHSRFYTSEITHPSSRIECNTASKNRKSPVFSVKQNKYAKF
jgi:hypothetical protein